MQPIHELLNLNDKTALVTGGAAGIGEAITRRLHEAGAQVLIADLNDEVGQALADTLGERATYVHTDVAVHEDVERAVHASIDTFGGLDILVNNAGIYPFSTLADMDAAAFQKVVDVNLTGVFHTTKAASEHMKTAEGGTIINITSIDALHPSMIGLSHYDASKHGVWGFTKNVALELAPHNIRVNALAPGAIKTPGTAGMEDPSVLEGMLAKIPLHRMGDPDEIGKAVLFLVSNMGSYVTGSQLVVDGGRLLS